MKKLIMAGIAVVCLTALAGCAAAIVGAGGTVYWQAGKIKSEELHAPAELAQATKAAFAAQKIAITSEVIKDKAIQLRGEDTDLKKIFVDIIKVNDQLTRLEIRYGIGCEREPARALLAEIKKNL